MPKWEQCCIDWYREQAPRFPKKGNFKELHHCKTCGTPLVIVFQCDYPPESMTAKGYGDDLAELECKITRVEEPTQ